MKEITNEQKQVMLSGILGDGSLQVNGRMSFNCVHKEYMDFKKGLFDEMCVHDVREDMNMGYKQAPIFSIKIGTTPYGKRLLKYTHQDIVNELDELSIALWMFDDGSRHKTGNFYNINTHAIDRQVEEKVLIPFLNKHNIFPKVLTETKKDGRVFSYLYISKWQGAMELSRMMRKLPLNCYSYKLMPVELENAYFELKDTPEFINADARKRTRLVKDFLGIKHSKHYFNNVTSIEIQK